MDINAFAPPIHFNIIWLDEVTSTNEVAKQMLLDKQASHGTMIIANYQTNGRGQLDNAWESESENNILCSFILEPAFLNLTHQTWFNMAMCLTVRDALAFYTKDVAIKWPNDIYINDKKVAGILIENTIQGSTIKNIVVGIGININQQKFSTQKATSLFNQTSNWYNRNDVLQQLINHITVRYKQLWLKQFDKINSDYHQVLYGINQILPFKTDTETFSGMIKRVNANGHLVVDKNGTEQEFMVKQISLV